MLRARMIGAAILLIVVAGNFMLTSTKEHAAGAASAPTVTTLEPGNGPVGQSVTILGSNFTTPINVSFNGTPSTTVYVESSTRLRAIVPNATTNGTVTVTTQGGSGTSATSFTVTASPTATNMPGAEDTSQNVHQGLVGMNSVSCSTLSTMTAKEVLWWNPDFCNPSSYPRIFKGFYFEGPGFVPVYWFPNAPSLSWFQTNHPDWVEFKCNASTVSEATAFANPGTYVAYQYGDSTRIPLDATNSSAESYLENTFYAPIAASGNYSFLFFDNWSMHQDYWTGDICGHYDTSGNWVQQYSGTDDDPNYRKYLIYISGHLQSWIHTNYPNMSFGANFSYVPTDSWTSDQDALLSHIDVLMDEQGGTHGNNAPPWYYADSRWVGRMQHMQTFLNGGHGWVDVNQQPVSFSSLTQAQKQWALADYLMLRNNASWMWTGGSQEYQTLLTLPEYSAATVGTGQGQYYADQGVYRRDFTNGVVFVNPSSTTSYTVNLPANTYKDLYGNAVSSVTLAPVSQSLATSGASGASAIVLVGAESPASLLTPAGGSTPAPTATPVVASPTPTATLGVASPTPTLTAASSGTNLLQTATATPTPTPALSATNVLRNGSFETGISPWGMYTASPAVATATQDSSTATDGTYSARVDVTTAGTALYQAQLYQAPFALTGGQTYSVSFWAKSGVNGFPIQAVVQQNYSPYNRYDTHSFTLSTSWQEYTYTFTQPTTDANTDFTFLVGQQTGSVWFDNAILTAGSRPTNIPVPTNTPTSTTAPSSPTATATLTLTPALSTPNTSGVANTPLPAATEAATATATLAPAVATAATTSTPVSSTTAAPSGATFSNSFDDQSTGALVTGSGANQFSGTAGFTRLSVENTAVSSPPNALAVTLDGGGRAYADKQYSGAYTTHDITFNVQVGTDFTLGSSNDYVNLAQTVPSTSSNVGKVTVVLPGDNRIRLDYFDSAGKQHDLWGSYVLPTSSWHTVELRETVGAGTGSLALLVDGNTVAGGSNLDLGTQGVTWFAVGERYSPPDSGTAGHLYIDDVTAKSTT